MIEFQFYTTNAHLKYLVENIVYYAFVLKWTDQFTLPMHLSRSNFEYNYHSGYVIILLCWNNSCEYSQSNHKFGSGDTDLQAKCDYAHIHRLHVHVVVDIVHVCWSTIFEWHTVWWRSGRVRRKAELRNPLLATLSNKQNQCTNSHINFPHQYVLRRTQRLKCGRY